MQLYQILQCFNGGIRYKDTKGNFHCKCLSHSSGLNCEFTNPCFSNPCKNQGYCENYGNDFKCICKANFTGNICENMIPLNTLANKVDASQKSPGFENMNSLIKKDAISGNMTGKASEVVSQAIRITKQALK